MGYEYHLDSALVKPTQERSVMLLERGICDISQVLVLARNSVYSARSVEDAIPHVYKMEGDRSFRENPLILSP